MSFVNDNLLFFKFVFGKAQIRLNFKIAVHCWY